MLSVLDSQWKDHLRDMDHLKEGIGLRGYGQHDPLVEYKRESFDMFEAMMQRFQEETARYLYLMQILERPATVERSRRWLRRCWPEAGVPAPDRRGTDGNGSRPPRARRDIGRRTRRSLPAQKEARTGTGPHGRIRRSANRCSRSCAARRKLDATIPVPAAPARNTRSAAEPRANSVS